MNTLRDLLAADAYLQIDRAMKDPTAGPYHIIDKINTIRVEAMNTAIETVLDVMSTVLEKDIDWNTRSTLRSVAKTRINSIEGVPPGAPLPDVVAGKMLREIVDGIEVKQRAVFDDANFIASLERAKEFLYD